VDTECLIVNFPLSLEALSIRNFNIEFKSIMNLTHLNSLEFFDIQLITILDSNCFNRFENLTSLHIENCCILLTSIGHDKNTISFDWKYLENLVLNVRMINDEDVVIYFRELPNLLSFTVNKEIFRQIEENFQFKRIRSRRRRE